MLSNLTFAKLRPFVSVGRRLCTASATAEFTLAPYRDVYALGYGRGTQFLMLTLRHPAFEAGKGDAPACEVKALYAAKQVDRKAFVDELFDLYDTDKSGALSPMQLKEAMAGIGVPVDEEKVGFLSAAGVTVQGILRRLDENSDGQMQRKEFEALVQETWGGPLAINLIARGPGLSGLYDSAQKIALTGTRNLVWCGRTVPSHFVLRSLRNTWPFALKSVALLRNTKDNRDLDPTLMEI